MKRSVQSIVMIAIAIFTLSFCSGSSPQIVQTFWQRNYRFDPSNGLITHELSLYLHVSDDDGFDDLESIYLIADDGELFWEIKQDAWIKDETQGEIWIGSNRLMMSGGSAFPAGDYRVVLLDKAGERSRAELFIPPMNSTILAERFPRLSVTDTEARIGNGEGRRHILWFYNAADELVKSYATADPVVRMDTVLSSREVGSVTEVYVYREEGELGIGLITGPVSWDG